MPTSPQLNLQMTQKESELVLTVSELNQKVKSSLERNFNILWVKGEVSNLKIPLSGHYYFSLKDKKSQVRAVMFKYQCSKLIFKPEDGLEVLVKAKVSLYEGTGSYQLIVESMEPVGHGALKIQFEQLKAKLEKQGLFKLEHKKPLPLFPQKIAVVTSPTGAAIKDILNVLERRFKGLDITIFPTMVQGEQAPKEIIRSIELANNMDQNFDVLIVARGGGSMEDLWCFNDEEVARSIFNSKIPVVTGIGHEIDFTISDFVSDRRAPTPSAATELIVKNKNELIKELALSQNSLVNSMRQKIKSLKDSFFKTSSMLFDPKRKVLDLSQKVDELSQRLLREIQIIQDNKKRKLIQMIDVLNSLSPLKVLSRGYSIVKNVEGKILKSTKNLKLGDRLDITVSDGVIASKVEGIKEEKWNSRRK